MNDWTDETIDWYAAKFGDDPSVLRLIDAIRLNGSEDVLDIGCGTGSGLRILAGRTSGALIGVDPHPRMIEHALRQTLAAGLDARITFHVAPAEALGLPDACCDLVLVINAIHHWSDIAKGLPEALRVLRPGGRLVIGGEPFGAAALGRAQDYAGELRAAGFEPGSAVQDADLFVQIAQRPVR